MGIGNLKSIFPALKHSMIIDGDPITVPKTWLIACHIIHDRICNIAFGFVEWMKLLFAWTILLAGADNFFPASSYGPSWMR